MNETTMAWDDLALFIAVASEGGLSPASRVTGRSAATLGRRMRVLERVMGCELFVRHGGGYEMTDGARSLLAELKAIEARIQRLSMRPAERAKPLVKVSAGTWTTMALLGKLDEIVGEPADNRLRFVAAEELLSISRREVNSPRNALDLALLGKGVALLPTFVGDLQPRLHRVGESIDELSHSQWIVVHQDDRKLPEVRCTIDRLCPILVPI